MPVVSIIVPLFNKEPYIGETIRSVLAQTIMDWEIIVVDNGSTDKGVEVVKQFSDPRIQLVSSPKQGPGAARNFGLGHAVGEWILFLDADDLLEPDYLAARMEVAERTPSAQIIAGFWQEFSDNSDTPMTLGKPAGWGQGTEAVLDSAIGAAPWILHAALLRRTWLTLERRWPEMLDRLPSEDAAFWFRVISGAQIAWSDHAGALYRVGTPTSRNAFREADARAKAVTAVIEHNLEFLRSQGTTPTPEQCRTLMRVFEDTYRRALAGKAGESARATLRQAETWLHRCPTDSMALRLRKTLGLRLFNLLRFGAW
jgi:glycosyltransferase involved in cell wall biosynthesis